MTQAAKTPLSSCLYEGVVVHRRLRPKRHRLAYRVAYFLIDLDDIPALGAELRLFGSSGWRPFLFRQGDHGDGASEPGALRRWAVRQARAAGVEAGIGRVRVLTFPRLLGYAFNPISVYFLDDRAGRRVAVLYEVNNTFGHRHVYGFPVRDGGDRRSHAADKAMPVSPFIPMEARYTFGLGEPGETFYLGIRETDRDGALLLAGFHGARRPLSDRALASVLLRFPLMTIKVIAAIHWEALKLWLKGVRFIPIPPPPVSGFTLGAVPSDRGPSTKALSVHASTRRGGRQDLWTDTAPARSSPTGARHPARTPAATLPSAQRAPLETPSP